jgi:hypothetical protein
VVRLADLWGRVGTAWGLRTLGCRPSGLRTGEQAMEIIPLRVARSTQVPQTGPPGSNGFVPTLISHGPPPTPTRRFTIQYLKLRSSSFTPRLFGSHLSLIDPHRLPRTPCPRLNKSSRMSTPPVTCSRGYGAISDPTAIRNSIKVNSGHRAGSNPWTQEC